MPKKHRETTNITVSIPNDIAEFVREGIKKDIYKSLNHGIVRLSRIGMEVEKERAKIVHSYETGFSIQAKEEKKEKK